MVTSRSTHNPQFFHLLLRGERLEENDRFVSEFERKGLLATTVPVLEFEFVCQDEIQTYLRGLLHSEFSEGLIITSPRSVDALQDAFSSLESECRKEVAARIDPELTFVVGAKTGQDLERKLNLGYNKESSESGSNKSLSDCIISVVTQRRSINGRVVRLLYPKSSLANTFVEEKLADQDGIRVISLTAYRTVVRKSIGSDVLDALLILHDRIMISGSESVVINFICFSPSVANSLKDIFNEDFKEKLRKMFSETTIKTVCSSIGQTTASALKANGLEILAVAEQPTPESIVIKLLESSKEYR